MDEKASARLTLWVNRGIAGLLAVLIFTLPALLNWFTGLRPLGSRAIWAILIGFYCCVPLVGCALWKLDRLLHNILEDRVFVAENVRCICRIRWCCLGVSLICLPAAVFYPPLSFMVVIMAFLTLVVSVLASVMDAAVQIRKENDLTI